MKTIRLKFVVSREGKKVILFPVLTNGGSENASLSVNKNGQIQLLSVGQESSDCEDGSEYYADLIPQMKTQDCDCAKRAPTFPVFRDFEHFPECSLNNSERVDMKSCKDMREAMVKSAENMDWQQVVLNGGPPCFHLEKDGSFCGRENRWSGHPSIHAFVSLADLLKQKDYLPPPQSTVGDGERGLSESNLKNACKLVEMRCRSIGKDCQVIFTNSGVEIAPLSDSGSTTGIDLYSAIAEAGEND